MARFELELTLGNAGMETTEDITRALQEVALKINRAGVTAGFIRDENGNRVGAYRIREA